MFDEQKTLQFRCLMSDIDVADLYRSSLKDVGVNYFNATQIRVTLNSEYIVRFFSQEYEV
jgi:hypothetical protein